MLQLGEGKQIGKKFETQRFCVDASAYLADGILYHLVVVGVELGQVLKAYPFQTMLFSELVVIVYHIDEGTIGNRYNSFARVTVYIAECSYLSDV